MIPPMNGRIDRSHKILHVDRFLASAAAHAHGRAGTVVALASIRRAIQFASERHGGMNE